MMKDEWMEASSSVFRLPSTPCYNRHHIPEETGLKLPPPGRIQLPDHFPITWPDPALEEIFWFWDQMHHPHAVTPFTASLDGPAFSGGTGKTAAVLQMPIKRFNAAAFNYYFYFGNEPIIESAEDAAAREKRMEAEMMARAPRVLQDWNEVYLPEVIKLNDRLRDFLYDEAIPRQLAEFLDEARVNRDRQWELHFLAVMPAAGAAMMFTQTYEETFGVPENSDHLMMLGGFPNKSVEAGEALYDLAQDALSSDGVADTIRATSPTHIFAELERTAAGREFAVRLRGYLDDYGWRSDQFEFADPSWREDPTPLVHNLKGYLNNNTVDPRVERQKAVRERERLVKEMLERAPNQAKRNTLEMFVTIAQQYLPVQENHNFYIDQMNTVLQRLPVLAAGRRLTAEGALETPDDAFYLTVEELQDALAKPDPASATIATRRRAEREDWSKLVPPAYIGTSPGADAPRQDMLERFFGIGREPSRERKVITGHPASRGTVTAPAKVVRNLGEADKLAPGDILVCEMTMPPWTPLFSIVSAVVADSGGVLSHCAIVAREYRIPCVVGTVNGTRRIKDGQILTVDGSTGVVRIER
jgi:pyruvate,water dikinase